MLPMTLEKTVYLNGTINHATLNKVERSVLSVLGIYTVFIKFSLEHILMPNIRFF